MSRISEILEMEMYPDHEDDDNNTCSSCFMQCANFGKKLYKYTLPRESRCKHNFENYEHLPCDCHVKQDIEATEAAINAYIAESYIKLTAVTRDVQAVLANLTLGNKVYTQEEVAEIIGEDEDSRYFADDKEEQIIQSYEGACDKESRNELRAEQRLKARL